MKKQLSYEVLERRIVELEQQLNQYHSANIKYQALFDSFPRGITITDSQGNIIETNTAAEKLVGVSKQEHEKRTIHGLEWRFLHPDGSEIPPAKRPAVIALKENRVVSNCEIGIHKKNNGITWLNVTAAPLPIESLGVVVTYNDVTENRQQAEQLKAVFDSAPNILAIINHDARVELINRKGEALMGKKNSRLLCGDSFNCRNAPGGDGCGNKQGCPQCPLQTRILSTFSTGEPHIDEECRMTLGLNGNETSVDLLISTTFLNINGVGRVLLSMTDITGRKVKERMQAAQCRLIEYSLKHSILEFIQKLIDEAENLTGSDIGFFHFIEDDKTNISLQTWSTRTLAQACNVKNLKNHYSIAKAGVWVDCVKEGKPVVHNDYDNLAHKKGFPAGHAKITRELVIPVFRGGKILAIFGVGNKPTDYQEQDVILMQNFVDIAWEIIERKRSEEAMQKSEELHKSILKTAMDGFWLTDTTGKLLEVNETYSQMSGYTRKELLSMHIHDIGCVQSVEEVSAHCQKIMSLGEDRFESKQKRKNGTIFDVEVSVKYRDERDGTFVMFIRDITDRKNWETRLQQAQKMESIGNLAGGIAHDFNNILSPITGMAEMLMDDLPTGSPEHENVQTIFTAGMMGAGLVKQILAFSRQDEQTLMPVSVQKVLKQVLKLNRSTIPSSIEVTHHLQSDCGPVLADLTQIYQIGMNLITNAYHAVEGRGGKIIVQVYEETITDGAAMGLALQNGQYVMLSVSDNGCGIPASILDKIFDPYFTTKEKGKGTGLGLAMVYGIVKKYGGDIKVFTEVDNGSNFNVYLPLMKKEMQMHTLNEPGAIKSGTERILLVDDEPSIAKLEKQILERLGYKVTKRNSSLDALDAFKAHPDAFDLIITDMYMPNMTGDLLARKILAIRPDIPIVICTGFSDSVNEEMAKAIGIKDFLIKPVTKSDMAKMVRKVLDDKKMGSIEDF